MFEVGAHVIALPSAVLLSLSLQPWSSALSESGVRSVCPGAVPEGIVSRRPQSSRISSPAGRSGRKAGAAPGGGKQGVLVTQREQNLSLTGELFLMILEKNAAQWIIK